MVFPAGLLRGGGKNEANFPPLFFFFSFSFSSFEDC